MNRKGCPAAGRPFQSWTLNPKKPGGAGSTLHPTTLPLRVQFLYGLAIRVLNRRRTLTRFSGQFRFGNHAAPTAAVYRRS